METMPTFEHDGLTFCYLDQKASSEQGLPVPFVFLHGIGGTVRQPSALMAPLPPKVRLIALDSRGHGETRPSILKANLRFSFTTFADDVVALMDHLELPRAVIGGISMGAGIALNLAIRFSERVAGLVLSRPAWLVGPMAPVDLYWQISELLRKAGAFRAAAKSPLGQFDGARALDDPSRLDFLPNDRPFTSFKDLSKIGVPTLVLATGHDPLHPLKYGHALASCIPHGRFLEVTSKLASPKRHHHEMREAIGSFLEELAAPASRRRKVSRGAIGRRPA